VRIVSLLLLVQTVVPELDCGDSLAERQERSEQIPVSAQMYGSGMMRWLIASPDYTAIAQNKRCLSVKRSPLILLETL
jgi:hypothetical protein